MRIFLSLQEIFETKPKSLLLSFHCNEPHKKLQRATLQLPVLKKKKGNNDSSSLPAIVTRPQWQPIKHTVTFRERNQSAPPMSHDVTCCWWRQGLEGDFPRGLLAIFGPRLYAIYGATEMIRWRETAVDYVHYGDGGNGRRNYCCLPVGFILFYLLFFSDFVCLCVGLALVFNNISYCLLI